MRPWLWDFWSQTVYIPIKIKLFIADDLNRWCFLKICGNCVLIPWQRERELVRANWKSTLEKVVRKNPKIMMLLWNASWSSHHFVISTLFVRFPALTKALKIAKPWGFNYSQERANDVRNRKRNGASATAYFDLKFWLIVIANLRRKPNIFLYLFNSVSHLSLKNWH